MLGKRRRPPQRAFVCKWKCLCTLPHLMLCSLSCSQGLVDKNDIIVSIVSYVMHCWYLCMTDPHILQAGLGETKPYSRSLTSGDHKRCDSESEPPFETHNVWGEYSQCAQMWRDAIAWGWGRWYFGAGLPFVHNCTMHKLQRTALELPNIFCALCPCRQLSRMYHLVIVGGGNPIWAAVKYLDHCWGQDWSIWTNFFAKCKFYICSYGVKFFWCIFQVFLPPKLVVF